MLAIPHVRGSNLYVATGFIHFIVTRVGNNSFSTDNSPFLVRYISFSFYEVPLKGRESNLIKLMSHGGPKSNPMV